MRDDGQWAWFKARGRWAALGLLVASMVWGALLPALAWAEPPTVDAFLADVLTLLEARKTNFAQLRGEKRGDPGLDGQMYQNAKPLVGCDINVLFVAVRDRAGKETASKAVSLLDFPDGPAAEAFLNTLSTKLLYNKKIRTHMVPRATAGALAGDLVDVVVFDDAADQPIALLGQHQTRKHRLALLVNGADLIAEASRPLEDSKPAGPALPASGPERVRAFYGQFVTTAEKMLTFLGNAQAADFEAGSAALQHLLALRDAVQGIPPTETGLKSPAEAAFLAVDRITVDTLKIQYTAALRDKVTAEAPEARSHGVEAAGNTYKVGPAGLELAQRLAAIVKRVRAGVLAADRPSAAATPANGPGVSAAQRQASVPAAADKKAKEVMEVYAARDATHRPQMKAMLASLQQSMQMDRRGEFNRTGWRMYASSLANQVEALKRDIVAYQAALAALGLKRGDNELHDLVAAYLPLAARMVQATGQWAEAIADPGLDDATIKQLLDTADPALKAMAAADRAVLAALAQYNARNAL